MTVRPLRTIYVVSVLLQLAVERGRDRHLTMLLGHLDLAFDADQVELQRLGATPEGLAKAKWIRQEYKQLPKGLHSTLVKVKIQTEPPGVSVRFPGRDLAGVTPLVVRLPLRGRRGIVLWKKGYKSVRGLSIEFDDMAEDESPVFSFKLIPER